jgi:hypothetical protein
MYYRFDACIEYMKKAGLKTKWREESEERVGLEQLSDIPGFEWIDEDSFVDMEKHPYFRMRGKRVTKEQAFDIISRESENKRNHFIKRAENIIEESPALQFTEIKLHHTSRFDWIRSWIDPDGAVGETNYCAWKYPDGLRLMEEHMLNAKRYPFLKYVIVYTMHDAVSREDLYYEDGIFHDIEDTIFWGGFEYALWVHDGGVERVDRDKAKELYEEYQSEYPCEEMFMRDDWNKYIKPYLDEEYVLRLSKAWKQLEEEREEMLSLNIYECKTVEEYFKDYYEELLRHKKDLEMDYSKEFCEKVYRILLAAAKEVERFSYGEIKQGELDMQFYWDIIREIGKNKREYIVEHEIEPVRRSFLKEFYDEMDINALAFFRLDGDHMAKLRDYIGSGEIHFDKITRFLKKDGETDESIKKFLDDIDVFGDENLRKMVLSYVDYKEKELDKRIPWDSFAKELKESLKDTDITVEWNNEKVYFNKGELTIFIEKKDIKKLNSGN